MMLSYQLSRFVLVGSLASITHFFVVISIVSLFHSPPLITNLFGFSCAFFVSYFGHRTWTFNARNRSHKQAIFRFFIVAIIGLGINETSYALLLNSTRFNYITGLVIAIIVAAASTYLLSRLWVFHETA
jgi:putative flippase GtrA